METDSLGNEAASRLVPVLARAIELGRGPAGLLGWVLEQLPASIGPAEREPLARRLAGELTRYVARHALAGTRNGGETLRATRPGAD
jgi:hypothetical protein